MLIQYNICGTVTVNSSPVTATLTLRNLTTGFVSDTIETIDGYYNVNLANYPNTQFDVGNIVSVEFEYTNISGTTYFSRVYFVINENSNMNIINARLYNDWDYSAAIQVNTTDDPNRVTINFITTFYRNIIYKLYYKYDGVYKEISSATIDVQTVDLIFPYSGDYLIIGYVTFGSMLTAYASKEFNINIDNTTNTNNNIVRQIRYIEWE